MDERQLAQDVSNTDLKKCEGSRVADDGGLTVHSRRTERLRKKQQRKLGKSSLEPRTLFHLPYELAIAIFSLLRPSDLFQLSRTNKGLHDFIVEEQGVICKKLISWRYQSLQKCFRLPVLIDDVDLSARQFLWSDERQGFLTIHKKPYQHIQASDPSVVCTCLTCLLRWNALCLAVDFAHWQSHLDNGEPIPVIPRGRSPAWNTALIASHATIVSRALHSPLWHARILETHLSSTTRSIRRHAENKGNRRRRFRMTAEDERAGTDAFLERSGPPTTDFPFHRDNYYLLEACLPGRGWNAEEGRWMYVPAEQHDIDVQFMVRRAQRTRAEAEARRTAEVCNATAGG